MTFRTLQYGLLLASLCLSGCASLTLPTYQSSVDNSERLMRQKTPVAVGPFSAADGVENTKLSVRGSPLASSENNQFSAYLKAALVRELTTAGRLDPASDLSVEAVLTRNELAAASVKTGTARLGATFTVKRAGTQVYQKSHQIEHTWDASFIGAIAIPAAVQNYSTAVQKLIGALLADPDFNQAIEPNAP